MDVPWEVAAREGDGWERWVGGGCGEGEVREGEVLVGWADGEIEWEGWSFEHGVEQRV